MSDKDEVFGLFPTPFMRAPRLLDERLVAGLVEHFSTLASDRNKASAALSHTEMLKPGESPLFLEAAALITPKIVDLGALMFGERLGWAIKEMWVNLLQTGGAQSLHNHANSFISGVVYLTTSHASAQTVFTRSPGGTDFVFRHEHEKTSPTPFNADRWIAPAPTPGDLVLFPSYLLHLVPPNESARRLSLSFNAIPSGFDSWGYKVSFGA